MQPGSTQVGPKSAENALSQVFTPLRVDKNGNFLNDHTHLMPYGVWIPVLLQPYATEWPDSDLARSGQIWL